MCPQETDTLADVATVDSGAGELEDSSAEDETVQQEAGTDADIGDDLEEPDQVDDEESSQRRTSREPRASLRTRVTKAIRQFEERAPTGRRRERVLFYLLRLSVQLIRQWARDRCPQQAASLAFQTMLSIVPAMAVGLAAMRVTGTIEAESSFIQFIADRYIPVAPDEIAATLRSYSENVTFESLGLVGLITVIFLSFIMFNSLEKVMNQIWRVEKRRSMAQKFVVFYATATIGPALISISYINAASVGLTQGFQGYILSFVISYVALFLANFFIPATPVRLKAALVGALVTTILFEAAKYGFNYYANFAFDRYAGIYGAVAAVPLFLIWIYWSWLILLLGTEVAHAAQNIRFLERIERRGRLSFEDSIISRVNGPVAARLMVAVSEVYLSGGKTIGRNALATRLDVDDDVLVRLTDRLMAHDLLLEVDGSSRGFLPARPPSEITLANVLNIFRGSDQRDLRGRRPQTQLDRVLANIEGQTAQIAGSLTIAELTESGGRAATAAKNQASR